MRYLIVFITIIFILMALAGCTTWQIERAHPPIGAYVEAGKTRLHYVDIGPVDSGRPPVVLLHGASANLKDMKVALGDGLSADTRVLIFDRPGRGYSSRPDQGYRVAEQARLIHDALQKLEIENPVILGQSFGGIVALSYALQYQDEMAGLVLLAPVSHEWPGGVVWYNEASQVPVLGFFLRRALVPLMGPLKLRDSAGGAFWPRQPPENYIEDTGLPLLFRPKDFKANAADIANLKPQIADMVARYDTLMVPTLIYAGTHDVTVSPTIHSYILDQQLQNSSLVLIEDEGHGLHHTSSAQILDGVREMLDDLAQPNQPPTDEVVAEDRPVN
ncbi:MAG: alpha/beta hydrolase [Pseudomonadota bacterium]